MNILKSINVNKIKGFTLVELVIVLLIIGLLASMAIPRFINLKRDSQISALKGVMGTLHSTTTIYQSLAAIKGIENGRIPINGANVQFHSGFPDGHWNNAFRYILDMSTKSSYTNANSLCSQTSLCGVGMRSSIPTVAGTTGGRGVIIWPEGYRIREHCFTYYYNPRNGDYPLIGLVDTGC